MFAQLCRVGPSKEDHHKIIKHTQTRIGFVIFQALAVAQSFLTLLKLFNNDAILFCLHRSTVRPSHSERNGSTNGSNTTI
jgi:hypothetical protein